MTKELTEQRKRELLDTLWGNSTNIHTEEKIKRLLDAIEERLTMIDVFKKELNLHQSQKNR